MPTKKILLKCFLLLYRRTVWFFQRFLVFRLTVFDVLGFGTGRTEGSRGQEMDHLVQERGVEFFMLF